MHNNHINSKINKKRIREKRKWDVLKEFRRLHSPAPQSLYQKKGGWKKGKGRGGEVVCLSKKSNLHKPN